MTKALGMEWFLQVFLIPGRIKYRWKNRNRRKVTTALIMTIKARYDEATRGKVPSYIGIYNVGLFIVLLEQDISAYSEAMFFARSEWHRHFFARGLAVLLFEGSKDVPQLLGKEYRQWLKSLDLGDDWFEKLNEIGSSISQFRKSHSAFLSEIRNLVGAHREKNASKQLDVMDKFNSIDIYKLGVEFSASLRVLVDFYIQLLTYMHKPSVMFHHVAKTFKP